MSPGPPSSSVLTGWLVLGVETQLSHFPCSAVATDSELQFGVLRSTRVKPEKSISAQRGCSQNASLRHDEERSTPRPVSSPLFALWVPGSVREQVQRRASGTLMQDCSSVNFRSGAILRKGQSTLAPSLYVHRHVYFWNEKTEPEQLLSSSVLPGWLVLGVATHCHIDDQIDVLDKRTSKVFCTSKITGTCRCKNWSRICCARLVTLGRKRACTCCWKW